MKMAKDTKVVLENEMQIQVQGRISKKENKSNQIVYTLDQCYLNHKTGMIPCHQILVYQNQDGYPIGKTILVTGKAVLGRTAVNEGNFDEKSFYFSRKIACSLQNATIIDAYGKENTYKEKLFQLQQKFCTIYQQCMKEDTAGILLTMLLGDKSLLDAKTKELYQKAGISHILAISGVKTLKLGIPLVPETRINWAFVPLHIAIIYILKLCLDEEIIPRCRFPCSRGYLTNYINWQKKQ